MPLFLESIRIENGRIMNPEYHLKRMAETLLACGIKPATGFPEKVFSSMLLPEHGLHKLRIIYRNDLVSIEILPYEIKIIKSLKAVRVSRPDYSLKYADRSVFDKLFNLRKDCDDIIIVCDDFITDTSYCNIAFGRKGLWFTPARPLLKGTMRQYLLDHKIISEDDIKLSDIGEFDEVILFNAMITCDRAIKIDIS
ncbi:MAG: aminotransferase class IV [Bacteroidales bacterium]